MTVQANMAGLPEFTRQAITGLPSLSLTALGNSQTTGLALATDFNVFTTVASSTGCQLPWGIDGATSGPVQIGDSITVVNHGANALSVYPQSGGKIANGSANAAFSVSATKLADFTYIGGGNWAAAVSA
nr:hypothetical protein [uncultured Rhodopila sp.]